jgi:molybdenum cofactor guanylyltransferase
MNLKEAPAFRPRVERFTFGTPGLSRRRDSQSDIPLEQKPITGIILSGGKSTRMGKNKALIEIEGIPIIERIHTVFMQFFREILIITDQMELFQKLQAKMHNDLFPNQGALGGLYTGLFFASFPYSFCVACDMPFLKGSLIDYLIRCINGYEAVVPRTGDGLQPLHAIYSKACMGPIKELMDEKRTKIIDFYPRANVRIVEEKEFHSLDPQNESFINVNTPEDLSLLQAGRHPYLK